VSGEAELVRRYFAAGPRRSDVLLGIGDDAALLRPPHEDALVACTDVLTEGIHFPVDTPAEAVGHKALAVNLSDVAAMGARPRWALLALGLPRPDPQWLAAFARGLMDLADQAQVALVGGDLCRGPLSATVTLLGSVIPGRALRRSGARPGDELWLSGTVGDAGLGLEVVRGRVELEAEAARFCIQRLQRPTPRLALGQWLAGRATAAIDVSDGLLIDLQRLCEASGAGALLRWESVPLSPPVAGWVARHPERWRLPLTAGDDYELLFTLPPGTGRMLKRAALEVSCTRVGEILAEPGIWVERGGVRQPWSGAAGYDHFAGPA